MSRSGQLAGHEGVTPTNSLGLAESYRVWGWGFTKSHLAEKSDCASGDVLSVLTLSKRDK